MPPYLSPLHIAKPSLPANCEPANAFTYHLSAAFHTCIPTNLALISTLLGTCSIISWLFAQLPQIYKNHKLKSTSGLSAFFLTEWLLGDLTNLLGCLFTGQASWQIIIAAYYVFVDCCLCGQWIWYEMLHHGRPLRPIWGRWSSGNGSSGAGGASMHQVLEGMGIGKSANGPKKHQDGMDKKDGSSTTTPQDVPRSGQKDPFRIPNFARSPTAAKESWQESSPSGTSPNPNVRRVAASSSPMPSPKTLLYITLLIAVLSNPTTAKPISPFAPGLAHTRTTHAPTVFTTSSDSASGTALAGKIFSWMSTFLYLGSRLPQLYMNQVRKSTAGLSPALFAAAFFGNLFYSSSLATNPCAWQDFAPGQGRGWVGPEGTTRETWILRAAPFFFGAAGVLLMDAAVGLQFWYFGDAAGTPRGRSPLPRDDEVIITVDDNGKLVRRSLHWRRVSGWMRGWAPAVSVAATPNVSRAVTPMDTPRETSPASESGSSSSAGSKSKSIPIVGGRGSALDEARALLGTSRHASPRSYGALGSPR
ncbi:uncharacterized protein SETTUDRAFT_167349 [Exserohilum turcica Et28A]|uniref:Uncharacterized protein n=1 Tax=Exserohilum turcicum (strain 28A) TaxID=671987 RepID=R0J180_EXST2|nr:uncharacterized protein SETTUDRAFT_167349 [Exserohilum turcica Et28A]EOA90531.1 hypothetical protein SETTUDRAFT_167349 [Exserohilum turcica Et28A]